MIKYYDSMFGILPDGFEEYIKEFLSTKRKEEVST